MPELVATSMAELTILTIDSPARRRDWDWVVGKLIRAWEVWNAARWKANGLPLVNGELAWYHWHEICDRAFATVCARYDLAEETVAKGEDKKVLKTYADWVTIEVYHQCQVEFESLRCGLRQHGLYATSFEVDT